MTTENSRLYQLCRITGFSLLVLLVVVGCSTSGVQKPASTPPLPAAQHSTDPIAALLGERAPGPQEEALLQKMGYATQVGAFADLDNAVRLEQALQARGIDAYYFRHESGLYKVRFGNHASYQPARSEAELLQSQGLIDTFFIVFPEDYTAARIKQSGRGDLRSELVETARQFIGIPYHWGGTTAENGFDCSGLTMVSYRLNGLNLPRVSRNQFEAGKRVSKAQLRPGDLVFFATEGGTRVTHVGMYVGDGDFIHAPRTGKNVRIEKLSNSFFAKTYMGGRTYL
ncbi:MAG: C40 family peptidase [Desulfuromonadales bacterium]